MRYYYNRKTTVEESCDLTVQQLKKYGLLKPGFNAIPIEWVTKPTGKRTRIVVAVDISTDDPFVLLMYTLTDRNGNKTDYNYEVSLLKMPCNFGGIRYWFACPICSRRVGNLYRPPGDIYFCCRGCHNLTYNSRNESRLGRFGNICYNIVAERKIEELYSQIKRWTWRGRPTRKVRKLRALERKADVSVGYALEQLERLEARISKH